MMQVMGDISKLAWRARKAVKQQNITLVAFRKHKIVCRGRNRLLTQQTGPFNGHRCVDGCVKVQFHAEALACANISCKSSGK